MWKKILWAVLILGALGFLVTLIGLLTPESYDCGAYENPLSDCGFIQGFPIVMRRALRGLTSEETFKARNQLLRENQYLKDFIVGRQITFMNIKTRSYSDVGRRVCYINQQLSWERYQWEFLFELGHMVYSYEFCPKVKLKGLHCAAYSFSPDEIKKTKCIQTHLFAKKFADSGGRLVLDPSFVFDWNTLARELINPEKTEYYYRVFEYCASR